MPSQDPHRIVVVGGGASGMMAAISARRSGANVTVLERNPRVGKKILVTGNGRCNLTNMHAGIANYHGMNPGFVQGALDGFGVQDTIRFFEQLGIAHKVEGQGKVYPMSDQASSVLDVLRYELTELGAVVLTDAHVAGIQKTGQVFSVLLANGSSIDGERVIIATGGKAMPSTGSDGHGYALATAFGHGIVDIFPGLVQLKLEGKHFRRVEGVRVKGTAELLCDDQTVATDSGDLLFANYGLTGPPILQVSRKAGELLGKGRQVVLKVVLLDGVDSGALERKLADRSASNPRKTVEFSLVGLINKRLIPVLLLEAGIETPRGPVGDLSKGERARIATILTDWRFPVRGLRSWPSAQVTAGGIDTAEVDPRSLESRRAKGLYFTGEILDIDGECGGFNLQWAWSSGYVAGRHAARSLEDSSE